MRLKKEPIEEFKFGETRIKTRFLFIPKKIENEWRWLEQSRFSKLPIRQ